MNTPNEEPKPTDNMELLKQQSACCGAGCSCHSSGVSGKARWGICAIVLIAAGVLAVKAMTKTNEATKQESTNTFATPVVVPVTPSVATSEATPVATSITTPEATPMAPTPVVPVASAPATGASEGDKPAEAGVGTMIGALAELNTVAANSDAVFVYLPGKEAAANKAPTAMLQAAVRTIEAKGTKCALFTLKAGSADYDKLGPQMTMPGVLALVKGKGMSAVSGEITETKLVQGYVAASSAGACGSGGCAPGTPGCN